MDISNLSKDELLDLNNKIVDRLKALQESETIQKLSQFKPGNIVSLDNNENQIPAIVLRANKKTISILTEDNINYKVSPSLIKKRTNISKKLLAIKNELFPHLDN